MEIGCVLMVTWLLLMTMMMKLKGAVLKIHCELRSSKRSGELVLCHKWCHADSLRLGLKRSGWVLVGWRHCGVMMMVVVVALGLQ